MLLHIGRRVMIVGVAQLAFVVHVFVQQKLLCMFMWTGYRVNFV